MHCSKFLAICSCVLLAFGAHKGDKTKQKTPKQCSGEMMQGEMQCTVKISDGS